VKGINLSSSKLLAAVVLMAVATAAPVLAANVDITITPSGTAAVGATVTATAAYTINDGSTFQSMAWSQKSGAPASLTGTTGATVTAVLGTAAQFKAHLIDVLGEPPIEVEEEYFGGLQNRFYLPGISPLQLEEAEAVVLEVAVTTTSGTYKKTTSFVTPLSYRWSSGLMNTAVGLPVLVHGKDKTTTGAAYDWALTPPSGSATTLVDATTQNPEFTPDKPGQYKLTVTGNDAKPVTMTVYVGTWKGQIVGKDANGRPTSDPTCLMCHNGGIAADTFTPWAQSGHAEIFSQNVDAAGHYGESCFACHMVGWDKGAANNGADDQADYAAMIAAAPWTTAGNNWATILTQYPATARLANIQCENCHGPNDSAGHMAEKSGAAMGTRVSLSSDVCGVCHGEPARHGRYQQWQISGHGNYETAIGEGLNTNCTRCHSANGFIQWQDNAFDPAKLATINWTADQLHPQTCQTCHDPHAVGTVSGETGNATVRISGNTPMLTAGFQATNVGKGAICMTCHNGRRGLMNDSTYVNGNTTVPHEGPQADVFMGQNAFLVEVNAPGGHALIDNTCVTCHMEKTDPPADLSYQLGGTNHAFTASKTICSQCHTKITADAIQVPFEAGLARLKAGVENGILNLMKKLLMGGNVKIDLAGKKMVTDPATLASVAHLGRSVDVHLADGTTVAGVSIGSIKVLVAPNTDSAKAKALYLFCDQALPKAAYNYWLLELDGSKGVHNPGFSKAVLQTSIYAVEHLADVNGPIGTAGDAGGTCDNFQYWTEIAAHAGGFVGTQWRTDLVIRNTSYASATVDVTLYGATATKTTQITVGGGAQGILEDVVGLMGIEDKGSIEVCSNQPLEVLSRIYNQTETGTYGQLMDGRVWADGLATGQTGWLLGLRQKEGEYRTNISVTNTGSVVATVTVVLFANDGTQVGSFDLSVEPGKVVQDLRSFAGHGNQPNIGWGFAAVQATAGTGIISSASVVDDRTGDATTISMK
jgi:hypothetical protein